MSCFAAQSWSVAIIAHRYATLYNKTALRSMRRVVITKLMGGLGNQMFQYAAGRALAIKHSVPLLLDRSFLDRRGEGLEHTLRDFELDVYRTQYRIAAPDELAAAWRIEKNRLLRRVSRRFPWLLQSTVFRETSTSFMPAFRQLQPPVALEGFWQCERHFIEIRKQLLEEFRPREPVHGLNADLLEKIHASAAVSLHVRRSDYVSNPEANRFHGVCSIDYYERAAAYHAERVSDPQFFVFSDEPAWVKANIRLPYATTYVSNNKGRDSYWDMFLMRHCRRHIIANSSFSWWGAWLGEFPGKTVIAPKRWFAAPDAGEGDIVPGDWIRL
jgi:hypothetical protein